jgi:hypothetical protein
VDISKKVPLKQQKHLAAFGSFSGGHFFYEDLKAEDSVLAF